VLAINPNDVDAINNKANALGKLWRNLEAIQYYQRAIKLIKSNQTSRLGFTLGAKPIYIFVSENDASNTQLIQAMYSGDNGQSQKLIISINMSVAEKYASINEFPLAISTYSEILHYDECSP
jgi:tetratricopeptide (TPR) repeat protein